MNEVILLIDDSVMIHKLVKTFLRPGFEVISAYDGTTGLIAAKRHHPHLILLDVEMPDLQGYEVCEHLKANRDTRAIPVMFLTSASDLSDRNRGLGAGACDFIAKSFEPAEFCAKIGAALHRPGVCSLQTDVPATAAAPVLTPISAGLANTA